MKKELKKEDQVDNLIVIPDECGDSLWDAVLAQHATDCDVKNTLGIMATLPNRNNNVQVCDATEAK